MQRDMLAELDEQMINDVEGGSVLVVIDTIVYMADVYNYYSDMRYVTTYNATVVEAGRSDLIKSTPSKPQFKPGYTLTR